MQVLIADLKDQHQSLQLYIEHWGRKQEQVLQAVISVLSKDYSASDKHEQMHVAHAQPLPYEAPDEFHSRFDAPPMTRSVSPTSTSTGATDISEQFHRAKRDGSQPQTLRRSASKVNRILSSDNVHNMTTLSRIVVSDRFEMAMGLTILANSIIMGISAEYDMNHIDDPDNAFLEWIERMFVFWYTFEVILRLKVYGWSYFRGLTWKWNCLDITLVVVAIFDQLAHILTSSAADASSRVSIMRMLRLVKMVRMLRIIRALVAFRELRLILHSMLSSMQAMFWASMLLLMVSYVVSVCFVNACMGYLKGLSPSERVDEKDIYEYWGSIGTSMLSLFQSCTGGVDWEAIAHPLWNVGIWVYFLFNVYVAFFMFVITNTLTSIFIDTVMTSSAKDENMMVQQELEKQEVYIARLEGFFNELDTDKDGLVSYEQFREHCDNPEWHALAASLDIDVTDAKQCFFNLAHGTGEIDLKTWVVGCIKMKGVARSLDLLSLSMQAKKTAHDQRHASKEMTLKVDKIEAMLGHLLVHSEADQHSKKDHHSNPFAIHPGGQQPYHIVGRPKRDGLPQKARDLSKERISKSNGWWLDLCSTPSKDFRIPPERFHNHARYQ